MKVSMVFPDSYSFNGVNLTGGTPLVDLVECLGVGVEGTLGVIPPTENPLSAGWGASVEMIGLVGFPTLLSLSLVAGVVILSIGATGNWQH